MPPFASQLSPMRPLAGTDFAPDAGPADILQFCQSTAGEGATTQLVAELRQPCDVASLWIIERQGGNWLEATKRMTRDPIGSRVPPRVAEDLKQFDLVLERAVDYVGRAIGEGTNQTVASPKKKLVFQSTGKYVGSCAHKLHPRLQMTPVGSVECEPKTDKEDTAGKIGPLEIVGRRSSSARATAQEWLGFDPLWVFGAGNAQVWVVKAPSCGIPAAPPALRELTALVRAYSRDVYEFSFALPAAFAYAGERSGAVRLEDFQHEHQWAQNVKVVGETKYASESSDRVNRDGSTEKTRSDTQVKSGALVTKNTSEKAKKDGTLTELGEKTTSEETDSSKFNLYTKKLVESNEATVDEEGLEQTHERRFKDEVRPSVSLKKNGRELDATKFLNMALNVRTTFARALESIKNMVPSVGWKITADIKVLAGTIAVQWGMQNPEDIDPKDGKPMYEYVATRYVSVRDFWSVDISCVVVGATLTLMVGVEVKVNAWFWEIGELIVKLEGKLAGEEALKWNCTSDVPLEPPALEFVFKGSISGVCRANAAGRYLVDASATLSGGFQVTAKPHISFEHAPSLEGSIERLDTDILYWGSCGKEKPDPVKVTLYDKKTIWEGDLIGKTEEAAA